MLNEQGDNIIFFYEEYKRMKTHYDELMHFRKTIKGKPTLEQRILLACNNEDIEFYQTILFHNPNKANCDCRMCNYRKQGIDIHSPYQPDLFAENLNIRISIEDKLRKFVS